MKLISQSSSNLQGCVEPGLFAPVPRVLTREKDRPQQHIVSASCAISAAPPANYYSSLNPNYLITNVKFLFYIVRIKSALLLPAGEESVGQRRQLASSVAPSSFPSLRRVMRPPNASAIYDPPDDRCAAHHPPQQHHQAPPTAREQYLSSACKAPRAFIASCCSAQCATAKSRSSGSPLANELARTPRIDLAPPPLY